MDFFGQQNFNKNELQNAAVHSGSTFPAGVVGQLFFNTTDKILYLRLPSTWQMFAMGDNASIPSGSIMFWSGLKSSIPAGFSLCDGTNGTPNLLDKFLKGIATSTTEPGSTGGGTHTHSIGSHTHSFYAITGHAQQGGGAFNAVGGGPQPVNSMAHAHSVSGTTDGATGEVGAVSILPEYFELCAIQKA